MQHQEHYGDAAWRSLMTLSPQKKGDKKERNQRRFCRDLGISLQKDGEL